MRFIKSCIVILFLNLIQLETQAVDFNHRKASRRYQATTPQPNILFILVDELRHPVVYENDALRQWQRDNLTTMTFLQDNGVNFDHHYCGSTACAPSRTTLFTGQYPTLHGVSQTDGAAKSASDLTMFWLSPYTVPTAGNIFTQGDYATFYIGKWHMSHDDLYNPGTQDAVLSYDKITGIPNPHLINVYNKANMLSSYGFNNGWVGPEPHGSSPHQSGASATIGVPGRDMFFADEAVSLLAQLDQRSSKQPWFIVCSFVNPHDITLYGDLTKHFPTFNFEIDSSLPDIAPAPTANEDLTTKPIAQQSYKVQYQNAFQPTTDTQDYRQLYYSLQKKVDQQIGRVIDALLGSRFRNNTIVIFTSDHGDLLGAHSNFQKWFNMYEESIHVPLIFYSPTLLPQGVHVDMITSHVDLVPTFCGLANINLNAITTVLQPSFTDCQPLVGRNLSTVVLGTASVEQISELEGPILFQTYDQIFTGEFSENPLGTHYSYVTQPAFIDAVITKINGQIWKLARYYQDTSFSSPLTCTCSTPIAPADPAIQFEMYNLTNDPLETTNLANVLYSTLETLTTQDSLTTTLNDQLTLKALFPADGSPFEYILPQPS